MTRYRLRPHTVDHAEDHLWIAPLPDGPITRVDGAGVQILQVLEDQRAPEAASAAEIAVFLQEYLEDVPEGAELQIATFLDELGQAGVVDVIRGDKTVLTLDGRYDE